MTKYIQIANDIERKIIRKEYVNRLPTEQKLANEYNTSRVVISKALKWLAAKNTVETVVGSGTFVKERKVFQPKIQEIPANLHDGFYHSMQGKGEGTIHSHIVSFSIRTADEEEIKKLHLKPESKVYDIIRQRLVENHPRKLEYTIMPIEIIPGITKDVLHKSIYSYIQNELGLEIGKANRVISADKADAYDQDYLDCKPDDAVLSVHQIAFLKDGRPFEISETRDRYDRAEYILFQVKN
ncbi:GntR family transcriptional regulator [uncultured Lactobacillus sp.]|uniref:GntR family transcriptional regulator n=1 Tax=uncultured Lactobacillus sp. TaxID=153152 RepID=UPI002636DB99|nr:GntR family transcriptional regulator [uncultured Lactobacillus sp.]